MCLRPETPIQAIEEAARFEPQHQPPWLPTLQLDAFHPALYGGTGQTAPKDVARQLVRKTPRLMLSGGLKADNVAEYVRDVQPWAVDVASGTELSPGHKDHQKVRRFIQAAKSAVS
jgi:phosphoribosylanthranilate isomerase